MTRRQIEKMLGKTIDEIVEGAGDRDPDVIKEWLRENYPDLKVDYFNLAYDIYDESHK